ncbi:uncharacterized protein [Leptinotarsa decemlineata]|uniref:uncharacterized protein n=1 Tax=Leptinotarsa decemlineata TaxID=7539 RepID=UPI003D307BDD
MFTFSATGLTTPPMIIYPGKRLKAEIAASVPPEWGIGISDTGWMKAEVFQDYICNVLHPSLVKNNIKFPIILFVDGHSTHLTYELSDICKELKIILICLYPNATRILQPADVSAFKPIKSGWKKVVLKWRTDNLNCILGKDKFAPILEEVVKDYAREKTITDGFRATGLYPFNPDSIDFSKCLGGQNQKQEDEKYNRQPQPMGYETFQNILGEEKIKLFQNFCGKTDDDCTDFILLHKLWKEFHTVRKEPEKNTSRGESNELDPTEYQDEFNLTTIENQLELGQNNIHMSEPSVPTEPNLEDLDREYFEWKRIGKDRYKRY